MSLGKPKEQLPKQSYTLISVRRVPGLDAEVLYECEHCGKIIKNYAEIQGGADKSNYKVGLDCVKKLLSEGKYFTNVTVDDWDYKSSEIKRVINLRLKIEKQFEKYKVSDKLRLVYFTDSHLYPGTLTIHWRLSQSPSDKMWQQGIPKYCETIFADMQKPWFGKYCQLENFIDELKYKNNHYKES